MSVEVQFDGAILMPWPQTAQWSPAEVLAKDGQGTPIYAPYWTLTLSVPLTTGIDYSAWYDLRDSDTHTMINEHPETGVVTTFTNVYVDQVTPGQFDLRQDCPAQAGIDMVISRIVVS